MGSILYVMVSVVKVAEPDLSTLSPLVDIRSHLGGGLVQTNDFRERRMTTQQCPNGIFLLQKYQNSQDRSGNFHFLGVEHRFSGS